jgi:hypothetical protein
MVATLPLYLYQGDDWAALITVNNCDGTPFDLTDYAINAQIREGPADQTWRINATFTCAVVTPLPGAIPNQISISLTNQQTTALRNLNYVWDLQIVSPAGIVTTIVSGPVQVTPTVTRIQQPWTPAAVRAFEAARWRDVIYA